MYRIVKISRKQIREYHNNSYDGKLLWLWKEFRINGSKPYMEHVTKNSFHIIIRQHVKHIRRGLLQWQFPKWIPKEKEILFRKFERL